MPGGRGRLGARRGRVWEGFLTFLGMGGQSAWGCGGQTAERTGPDQVGAAAGCLDLYLPAPYPSPVECYLSSNHSQAGEEGGGGTCAVGS